MSEQFPTEQDPIFPAVSSKQHTPNDVVEIEVLPGVYEVYDKVTGELVDIGGGEEEA